MRKIILLMKWFALPSALFFFILFVFPQSIYATIAVTQDPNPVCQDMKSVTFTFSSDNNDFLTGKDYYTFGIWQPGEDPNNLDRLSGLNLYYLIPKDQTPKQTVILSAKGSTIGTWAYKLWFGRGTDKLKTNGSSASGTYIIFPKEACALGLPILEMESPVKIGATVPIKVKNINPDSEYLLWFLNGQTFTNGKFPSPIIDETFVDKKGNSNNIKTAFFSVIIDRNTTPGTKTLCLKHEKTNLFGFGKNDCEVAIPIQVEVNLPPQLTPTTIKSGEPGTPLEDASLFSDSPTTTPPLPQCSEWANLQGDPISIQEASKRKDIKCITVNTAIGPISTEPFGLVKSILSILLSLSGGIAVILIIVAGFRLMLSQGNPEAVQGAREQLTSAIVGFLFIIFSLVILQVIGVDILRIPGFK